MRRNDLPRACVPRWAAVAILAGGAVLALPDARAHAVTTACVASTAEPSEQFDAVNATDGELRTYGFPPRPDLARDPVGYAHWAAAIGARPTRIVPELVETAIHHGPRIATFGASNERFATSSNWSGFVASSGATAWQSKTFTSVAADFIVPAVSTRTCNDTWEYASVWAGLDGNVSPDVLQAGIEADAICINGATTPYYSPWYEWYPNAEIRITNLTANAGQSFYVHVWATSATVGNAWVQNLSTNKVAQCTFAAPSGTKLSGESAEWIIESPSIGGKLATLSEYGLDYVSGATATTLGKSVINPTTGAATSYSLVRSGVTESSAALIGPAAMLFTSH